MTSSEPDPGHDATPGSRHYRAWVGATQTYDMFAHMQFSLMTLMGLREGHTLLDVGCGSLRAGKLFMVYLMPGGYFGIEPERWAVEEGIAREVGQQLADMKRPRFLFDADFSCTAFDAQFDFILAQSIFSHATASQVRRCLAQVKACMKPESIFVASFVEGDRDYDGDAWVYPETIPYRFETMTAWARDAGLEMRRLDWFHMGGQTWVALFQAGLEVHIEHLSTLNQIVPLKLEMSHYRMRSDRLERIEKHPLFRFARRLRGLFR